MRQQKESEAASALRSAINDHQRSESDRGAARHASDQASNDQQRAQDNWQNAISAGAPQETIDRLYAVHVAATKRDQEMQKALQKANRRLDKAVGEAEAAASRHNQMVKMRITAESVAATRLSRLQEHERAITPKKKAATKARQRCEAAQQNVDKVCCPAGRHLATVWR